MNENLPVKIRSRLVLDPDSGCWLWQGAKHSAGYGVVRLNGKAQYLHRVVYEALVAPIPAGLTIDHLCRIRPCCNPAHLEVVTQRVNSQRVPHHHGDALAYLEQHGHEFDAIHASPPCQAYSITRHSHDKDHPEFIEPTRDILETLGLPYVIENVVGAPLVNPLTLCGTMFDLVTTDDDGTTLYLKRHRLFESNAFLYPAGDCRCNAYKDRGWVVGGVYGGGSVDRAHAKNVRRGGYTPGKDKRAALIGADWMTQDQLSQAIPPAYTQHIGEQLMAHLQASAA